MPAEKRYEPRHPFFEAFLFGVGGAFIGSGFFIPMTAIAQLIGIERDAFTLILIALYAGGSGGFLFGAFVARNQGPDGKMHREVQR